MTAHTWTDSVEIARPIEAVFARVADPVGSRDWIQGLRQVELVDPAPVRTGTRFRPTRSVDGRESTEEITVSEFVPHSAVAVAAGVMKGGIELRIRYALEPTAAGTRVTSRTEAEPKSLAARLVFGMFWRAVVQNDAGNLRPLKSLLEPAP